MYVKTVGAGLGGLLLGTGNGIAMKSSDLPQLHTEGNAIVDENGSQVTLRGTNIIEPQIAEEQRPGIDWIISKVADESNGWYTDVVRLPVDAGRYLDHPDRYVSDYLTPAVNTCAEAGIYCIVDWHRVEDYNTQQIDEETRTFWNHVAPLYADRSHVLYELFNEPIGPKTWDEDWSTWKNVAQPWVDLIRSHAPETPIIIGSPHWSQFTKYAAQDPFEGKNLIYTAHIYPAINQSDWDDMFGKPAEQVPVFVTEWGYENSDGVHWTLQGTTSGWGEPFRSFVESHPTMSWCSWNYDHVWQPVMVDDNYHLLGGEDYMGKFTQTWLADAASNDGGDSGGSTDDTAPNVTWVVPGDGDTVSGNLTLVIDSSDDVDTAGDITVERRLDGGSWRPTTYDDVTSSYQASWDTTAVDDGDHTLAARATDASGNTSGTTSLTVTVDNVSESNDPVVELYAVSEAGSPNPHAEITVDWRVSDPDGDLDTVWSGVVNRETGGIADQQIHDVGGGSAENTDRFKLKHARNATFDVRLAVTDATGNTATATDQVSE